MSIGAKLEKLTFFVSRAGDIWGQSGRHFQNGWETRRTHENFALLGDLQVRDMRDARDIALAPPIYRGGLTFCIFAKRGEA